MLPLIVTASCQVLKSEPVSVARICRVVVCLARVLHRLKRESNHLFDALRAEVHLFQHLRLAQRLVGLFEHALASLLLLRRHNHWTLALGYTAQRPTLLGQLLEGPQRF